MDGSHIVETSGTTVVEHQAITSRLIKCSSFVRSSGEPENPDVFGVEDGMVLVLRNLFNHKQPFYGLRDLQDWS